MSHCGANCILSITVVGFLWGATNPFLRAASRCHSIEKGGEGENNLITILTNFFKSFLDWRFTVPFLLNQSGSILFNVLVISFPVTVVVPCVNAIQFVATFVVGRLIGEKLESSSITQKIPSAEESNESSIPPLSGAVVDQIAEIYAEPQLRASQIQLDKNAEPPWDPDPKA
uniref:Transmembrane protein 234 homolog n=1 Tax=Caenorhabditis tropicalis TaxID=1561998 RepID=A0A1I7TK96_9PELO